MGDRTKEIIQYHPPCSEIIPHFRLLGRDCSLERLGLHQIHYHEYYPSTAASESGPPTARGPLFSRLSACDENIWISCIIGHLPAFPAMLLCTHGHSTNPVFMPPLVICSAALILNVGELISRSVHRQFDQTARAEWGVSRQSCVSHCILCTNLGIILHHRQPEPRCLHTYIRTCLLAYLHTYLPTYLPSNIEVVSKQVR